MSNKELAVRLYSSLLQASSVASANPNFHGIVKTPTLDEAVEQVAQLAEKLSHLEDN